MDERVTIKRRVKRLRLDNTVIPGQFHERSEEATLIKPTKNGGGWVRLASGNTIYRKARDIRREQ
jgi:hypothetical protein